MIPYQTESNKISGTNLAEVYKNASNFYKDVANKTKKRSLIISGII